MFPRDTALANCKEFVVEPYLKKLTLTLFKISTDTTVRVSYVDELGITHAIENGVSYGSFDIREYLVDGSIERYVLNSPYPGSWRIEGSNCEGIDPFYEPTQVGFNAVRTLISDSNYYLQYQFVDEFGNVVGPPQNPYFALEVRVAVTDSEGRSMTYNAKWLANRKVFLTEALTVISQSGLYATEVVMLLTHCNPEEVLASGNLPTVCAEMREVFRHSEELFIQ